MDSKQQNHDFPSTVITLEGKENDAVYSFHCKFENVTSFRQKYFSCWNLKIFSGKIKMSTIVYCYDDYCHYPMNILEHNWQNTSSSQRLSHSNLSFIISCVFQKLIIFYFLLGSLPCFQGSWSTTALRWSHTTHCNFWMRWKKPKEWKHFA